MTESLAVQPIQTGRFAGGFRSPSRRASSLFVTVALSTSGAACVSTPRPIFEPLDAPPAWPPPPAPARVQYVGQLRGAKDLKPPRRLGQGISRLFLGKPEERELFGPKDVVCTPDGERVWIADPGGRCLHLFDLRTRQYKRVQRAGASLFWSPIGLCLGPPGSILVCDSHSAAIHQLSDRTGELMHTLETDADLLRPVALAFRPAEEELVVVDVSAHDVKVLKLNGQLVRVLGRRGTEPGAFNYPCDVADAGDVLWIADSGNQRVQGITAEGAPVVSIGQAGDAPGDLALPKSLAVDAEGHVYVVDARFENVQVFDRTGRLLLVLGEEGGGPGQFWLPGGVYVDATNRIWICDAYNRRVQVFQYFPQKPEAAIPVSRGLEVRADPRRLKPAARWACFFTVTGGT